MIIVSIEVKGKSALEFSYYDYDGILNYLYDNFGDDVLASNDIPLYIEASSWCELAVVDDIFETDEVTIEIKEIDD